MRHKRRPRDGPARNRCIGKTMRPEGRTGCESTVAGMLDGMPGAKKALPARPFITAYPGIAIVTNHPDVTRAGLGKPLKIMVSPPGFEPGTY